MKLLESLCEADCGNQGRCKSRGIQLVTSRSGRLPGRLRSVPDEVHYLAQSVLAGNICLTRVDGIRSILQSTRQSASILIGWAVQMPAHAGYVP